MILYSKLYADFQQTSRQAQTTSASGTQLWFAATPDSLRLSPPSVIILTDDGLTVEYPDRFRRLGFDGAFAWEIPRDSIMAIVAHEGVIYYRSSDHRLHGVDARQRQVLGEFYFPSCFDQCRVQLVMPAGDSHFIMQTFNPAREVELGYPPEKDSYTLALMGPDDWNDWDWLHEFEGTAFPGLTNNGKTMLAVPGEQGRVTVLDIKTGTSTTFEVTGAGFRAASIDYNDHLVAVVATTEKELKLISFTLAGEQNWECVLPGKPGSAFFHPPAVDGDNRIYVIVKGTVMAFDKGNLLWQKPAPPAQLGHYLTILGDNSLLVVGGNEIDHWDHDGNPRFEVVLDDGEQITTPPVIDAKGRIYVGTFSGIYCLE